MDWCIKDYIVDYCCNLVIINFIVDNFNIVILDLVLVNMVVFNYFNSY